MIATTSSNEKAELLKKLGADHVLNYRTSNDCGDIAKSLTGGEGVDLVIEAGGPTTLAQIVQSVKLDGTISIVGSVGGQSESSLLPTILDFGKVCSLRVVYGLVVVLRWKTCAN